MNEKFYNIKYYSVTTVLSILIVATQYSLWFGKEGWPKVWRRQDELKSWIAYNSTLIKRNRKLAAKVDNLLHGHDVLIEKARYRLGLVSPGEVFYYVYDNRNNSNFYPHG
ncbi:septum formation initiator family protein [Candidatus Ichthyocystis sparus]|uniref:septum formation initiator family protein n=1 Tax=Candidatus Ichthyocystis sparus TaxID=1561004 RepID=UPI000B89FB48|nr:septum formation initiator family protein [Candidatus Ichthyocystis sparus]